MRTVSLTVVVLSIFFFAYPETALSQRLRYAVIVSDEQGNLARDYGNSLATAIASIGSTKMLLTIDAETTCSTALTVPPTLQLRLTNKAKINKSARCTINFQGVGLEDPKSQNPEFSGFSVADITWTGATADLRPSAVSMELWDTGNNSLSDRLLRANAAFGFTQVKIIIPTVRTITQQVDFNANKEIEFTACGTYTSTFSASTNNYHMFGLNENNYFHGPRCTILQESAGQSGGRIIEPAGNELYAVRSNIIVEGLTFQGLNGVVSDGSGSTIILGNCHNCSIKNNLFDGVHYYAALLGGYGTKGNYAYNSDISDNTLVKASGQAIAIINAKNCKIIRNQLDSTGGVGGGQLIDIEPNTHDDFMEDIVIENNTISVLDAYNGTNTIGGIAVQGAGGVNHVKGVIVRNNNVLGMETSQYPGNNSRLAQGFTLWGVEDGTVENNTVRWGFQGAYYFSHCRRMVVRNNRSIGGGDAAGTNAAMKILATSDSMISGNTASEVAEYHAATGIFENEVSFTASSSASTVHLPAGGFYDFEAGEIVFYNGSLYTISSYNNATNNLILRAAVGTVTSKTFTEADVHIDTDRNPNTITIAAHGYQTGARIRFSTTGKLPSPLSLTAYPNLDTDGAAYYYLIRVDANTVKVATSLDNAVRGIAIRIPSAGGGGTHTILPQIQTRFSNNKYSGNLAPNGIVLAKTGTSTVF